MFVCELCIEERLEPGASGIFWSDGPCELCGTPCKCLDARRYKCKSGMGKFMPRTSMTPEQQIEKLIADQAMRIADLEWALRSVVKDIEDYERVNNLSPSLGKADCWQSVTHAKTILNDDRLEDDTSRRFFRP